MCVNVWVFNISELWNVLGCLDVTLEMDVWIEHSNIQSGSKYWEVHIFGQQFVVLTILRLSARRGAKDSSPSCIQRFYQANNTYLPNNLTYLPWDLEHPELAIDKHISLCTPDLSFSISHSHLLVAHIPITSHHIASSFLTIERASVFFFLV